MVHPVALAVAAAYLDPQVAQAQAVKEMLVVLVRFRVMDLLAELVAV